MHVQFQVINIKTAIKVEVFNVNWLENTRSMQVHFQVINIKTAIKVEVFTVNWLEKLNKCFLKLMIGRLLYIKLKGTF